MSSEVHIRKGLIKYYEGIIGLAEANVNIYFENSVGIGEHSDILEAVDSELDKIASAQDKIDVSGAPFWLTYLLPAMLRNI